MAKLGPDAFSALPPLPAFTQLVSQQRRALKAVLLDQSVLSGIGNWVADEVRPCRALLCGFEGVRPLSWQLGGRRGASLLCGFQGFGDLASSSFTFHWVADEVCPCSAGFKGVVPCFLLVFGNWVEDIIQDSFAQHEPLSRRRSAAALSGGGGGTVSTRRR